MLDWCSNYVKVEGDEENIKSFMEEMDSLTTRFNETGIAVTPESSVGLSPIANIYGSSGIIYFESRWVPANDTLLFLARKHKVLVKNSYEEPNSELYGAWTGGEDHESDVYLDLDDLNLINTRMDDDYNHIYSYDGIEHESKGEIADIILDKKIKGTL